MSGSAGSILVDLILNDGKFAEGMKRASKVTVSFEKQINESFKRIVGYIAAAAGPVALGMLTARQLEVIDSTNKMARQLGVANEEFQAMALVADEAGVAQENLGNLIVKGQKAIVEAAKGADKYEAAFKKLNLSTADLLSLRPDEAFERIVDKLSQIENPTIRNATAMDIFSKSGKDVILMLEDFSAKTEEARQFNEKFNISFSEIDGRKVEEANDAMGRLNKALGGIGNTIAIEIAPAITAMSNAILDTTFSADDLSVAVRVALDNVAVLGEYIRRAFHGAAVAIAAFQSGLASLTPGPLAPQWLKDMHENEAQYKQNLQDVINNFDTEQTVIDSLYKARDEATKRALEAQRSGKGVGGGLDIQLEDTEAIKRSQKEIEQLYNKNRQLILGLDSATLKYQDTVADLNKLLSAGAITQEQYNTALEGAQEEFEKASNKANLWAFDLEAASKRAAENIQDVLADYLFDPAEKGFKGMLKGFVDVLRRMAAEAAAANLLKGLFGSDGSSGLLGGLTSKLGNILPTVSLGSVNLPKFDTGINTVPYDMAAVIHKDEAVLNKQDAAAWRSGKSGGNTYHIDARGADQSAIRRVEQALITLAGPGVIEQRVSNAQSRGAI